MKWPADRRVTLLAAATAILAIGLGSAAFLYRLALDTPHGAPGNVQTVQIERGMDAGSIGRLLQRNDVIASARLLRLYLQLWPEAAPLQAGEYRFESPMTLRQVITRMQEGRVVHHRLTIAEGLDLFETVDHLEAAGWGSRETLTAAVRRVELIADLDTRAVNLEGYLFPETYFLTRDTGAAEIVETMVRHFRSAWNQQRQERAAQLGWTAREVLTLASLIEKEAALPAERTLVSSVFHNRLARGMRLACDPTVIYAVKLVKEYDGIIHQSDLDLDSPYNTYLYPGLPPGPIASPGIEAIDAALNPAASDYLYFVSRNDGSHVFSTNFRDHQRAVLRYQR